jgi:diguanylate cyclase (GGDEF)-like protein
MNRPHQSEIKYASDMSEIMKDRTILDPKAIAEKWQAIIFGIVDHAFEPIVNIHTGATFGYEALLRNFQAAGFETVWEFFESAYKEGVLYQVELMLREKAIEKFCRSGLQERLKLFLNVDNRVLEMPDYQQGSTAKILARYKLPASTICFEISEMHRLSGSDAVLRILQLTKSQNYKIAIDDFGTGFSGLQLMYYASADFIKIDRFFISNISNDSKKRFFVASIINMAHLLGITVIAEGIETEQEFYICRDLGCDLIQGHYIQKATTDVREMRIKYDVVENLVKKDRRKVSQDQDIIYNQSEFIPQIPITATMEEVFNMFLEYENYTFFPVTTENNEPVGIVREKDLKAYTYSMYGRQLLKNKSFGKTLRDFVVKCPIVDINTKAEKMLEIFSVGETVEGIIITAQMEYIGFLSAKALLRVLNEKNLIAARDQNPLTKLPGNMLIYGYVSEALADTQTDYIFVYYDFDNFKPYNDRYGFRNGDRVILLFAEILQKRFTRENCFVGHIGGDDFFVGFKNLHFEEAHELTVMAVQEFTEGVKPYYNETDRERGYIESKDRDGKPKRFPLLTVSAAMQQLPKHRHPLTMDEISTALAEMKKGAKGTQGGVCAATVYEPLQTLYCSNGLPISRGGTDLPINPTSTKSVTT